MIFSVHCRVRPWGKFAGMFTTLNAPDLQTNRTALTQVLMPSDNQVNTVRYTVDYLCTIVWPITHCGFCSFFEVKVTFDEISDKFHGMCLHVSNILLLFSCIKILFY